jgi:hypothetical protein
LVNHTNTPKGDLDVAASTGAVHLVLRGRSGDNAGQAEFWSYDGATRYGILGSTPSFSIFGSIANTFLYFITNNTERMRITSAGNVGIGTSTPNALVEANGNIRSTRTGVSSQYIQVSGGDAAGGTISLEGSAKTLVIRNNATSSSDVLFDQAVATRFTFAQAGTQILRIDADGVKFGTDSAAANALDDYEEGTWTMGVSFGGASAGVTFANNTGTYTKIGRQVTVTGYANLTSKGSSTGAAAITGLPFTIANTLSAYPSLSVHLDKVTFANQYSGYGVVGTTIIELREVTEAGVGTAITDADFANDSSWVISLTYFV